VHAHGWLWLTPVAAERASYAPGVVLGGMVALGTAAWLWLRPKGRAVRRAHPWSCGHPHLSPRMQYTATGFSQPLRRIFSGLYQPDEHLERQDAGHPLLVRAVTFSVHVRDVSWRLIYGPLIRAHEWTADFMARQHRRGLHGWLAWMFVTVLALLGWLLGGVSA